MTMGIVFNIFVSGLTLGAIYSLLSVAFVMVMKGTDIVHFALGSFLMITTVAALILKNAFGIPLSLAACGGIVFAGMVGFFTDRLIARPLNDRPILDVIFAVVALSVLMDNTVLIFWSGDAVPFPSLFPREPKVFLGLRFVPENFAVIGVAVAAMIALQLFFFKTRFGTAMRAVMDKRETASLMGINVNQIITLTFIISSILAGIAGVMVAPLIHVTFDMGHILIKSFVAAVIGGLYSIPGAIAGGLLVGLIENFSSAYISSTYRDVILYAILILGLLLKPSGLFKWGK
jgi:branched-chain amino acid transport system permease protein